MKSPPETLARMTVELPRPGVLATSLSGIITAAQLRDEFTPIWHVALSRGPVIYWISDLSGVVRFERQALPFGSDWIKSMKNQGGKAVIVITTSLPIRMVAPAASFAGGVPLKVCATRAEADAWTIG